MAYFLSRSRLLAGFLAVSVVIVAAAVSSGLVALRTAPAPDSPVTIRSNLDVPATEGQVPVRR